MRLIKPRHMPVELSNSSEISTLSLLMLRPVIVWVQSVERQQRPRDLNWAARGAWWRVATAALQRRMGGPQVGLATYVCTSNALRAWAQEIVMTHPPINSPHEVAGNATTERPPLDAIHAELDVRRALALKLGTTTRSALDEAAFSLREEIIAFADEVFAVEADMTSADRSFRLEAIHLVGNPPRPDALSQEVYTHVRAQARVLRKLIVMKQQPKEHSPWSAATRPTLPVRPRPTPKAATAERAEPYAVPSGLTPPLPEADADE
ncbi:hypothetical protein [Streptomyces anulatus]|uniref:hypothetical protein n=1 Tax=Streptomyces anulatus TaxID=1892 RepID=UPI0036B6ECC4